MDKQILFSKTTDKEKLLMFVSIGYAVQTLSKLPTIKDPQDEMMFIMSVIIGSFAKLTKLDSQEIKPFMDAAIALFDSIEDFITNGGLDSAPGYKNDFH